MLFRTVPSANTLVRWVNENAFAFIVQARPCPTFGRPVHLRGGPHRLQPGTSPHALRIPPRDGHPALRELRSGGSRSALVCFRLSPSCPFRPLHTFHSSRPARNYPRFWIRRSSFERRRDLNPPDQRAAQRTLRPRLTSARCSGRLAASPVAISATTRRPPEVSSAAFRAPLPEFTLGALDGYGLRGELPVRPTLTPQIRFLYIRSRVCSTLLSDPPSPERPCASLTLHLHQVG